jgi:UDP-glucose 4-epimerase
MTNILITGATGFLGQALVRSNKFPEARLIGRWFPVEGSADILELSDVDDFSDILKDVDVIIHLAGLAHLVESEDTKTHVLYKRVNTELTLRLAAQAANAGVKRFIYLSTIKVLGEYNAHDMPFRHTDPLAPSSPYAVSKAAAEVGLKNICLSSNMEFVIVRPPLIYGRNVKGNFRRLISLCKKRVILPFGLFTERRSYISLKNIIFVIHECSTNPKAANETFLVSDGVDKSIVDIITHIRNAGYRTVKLVKVPVSIMYLIFILIGKKKIYTQLNKQSISDISHTVNSLNLHPSNEMDNEIFECLE